MELFEVLLTRIHPNPDQPRTHFDEQALQALADSIQDQGVLQPIEVERFEDQYILHHGERRWRAAKMAGLKTIPAVVVNALPSKDRLIRALTENIQREPMGPLEEARALLALKNQGVTNAELCRITGRAWATLENRLAWLDEESELVRWLVDSGQLPLDRRVREAVASLPLEDREQMAPRMVGMSIKGIQKAVQTYHRVKAAAAAEPSKPEPATNGAVPTQITGKQAAGRPAVEKEKLRYVFLASLGQLAATVDMDPQFRAAVTAGCDSCFLSKETQMPSSCAQACPLVSCVRAYFGVGAKAGAA